MKIEIEKSEYDRLKSREEKLMAYYEWFVDKENDLATVEDIVNKNIELKEENKKLKLENAKLKDRIITDENFEEKLDKENKKLKSDLAYERTMLDNVKAEYKSLQDINKKLKAELSKYKKQYQHSMGFMEEDTLQELRDIGEI